MDDAPSSSRRWRRINEILLAALELPIGERAAWLEAACGDDAELRAEVDSLLEVDDAALDAVERPVVDLGRTFRERRTSRWIGPYQIFGDLGQGGMGKVYLAAHRDAPAGRRVAVKVLRRGLDTGMLLRRFERERQILERLEHPAIARLLDAGTGEDRRPYLVMEHVDGQPVDRWADDHQLSIRQRLELFLKICAATAFAHDNLVVHRDLKPSNILVDSTGEPRLLDFGIAKILEPETLTPASVTETGLRIMTPEYASPEQALGQPVTPRSDVYALGVLLYELLTGRRPYRIEGRREEEIQREIRDTDPERPSRAVTETVPAFSRRVTPSDLSRQLRGDLDHIVMTALRKDPADRYASAAELEADIRSHLAGRPVRARSRVVLFRVRRIGRRAGRWAAVAAIVVAVASGVWLGVLSRDELADRPAFDVGTERLERELAGHPELQAEAMLTLGRVHRAQRRWPQAVAFLERALERRRELYGGEHPQVAEVLDELALVHRLRGAAEASLPLAVEALAIRAALFGEEHAAVVRGRTRLAAAHLAAGNAATAGEHAELALAVLVAERPIDDEAVALARSVLGGSLVARGRHAEAEPLLVASWAVLGERRSVAEHDVRDTLGRLVELYEGLGRSAAAAPYRQRLRE